MSLRNFILAIAALLTFVFLELLTYAATRTPDVDDCMLSYARKLNAGTHAEATIYEVSEGVTHIDTETLPLPVIGRSDGCWQTVPNRPVEAALNSYYCLASRVVTLYK